MVMGLICALLITAMDLDWRAWFRWFIQSALIYLVLMVPTVTVKSPTGSIRASRRRVANIPIRARRHGLVHQPGQRLHPRTAGTVFVYAGGFELFNGGFVWRADVGQGARLQIRDPVFEANLDGYLKQCAYYDILLGTKSLKLLSESTDLWADLGANAATNRGMKYLTDTGGGTVDIEQDLRRGLGPDRCAVGYRDKCLCAAFCAFGAPKLTQAAAGAKLAADVRWVSRLLTGSAVSRNQFFKRKSMVGAFGPPSSTSAMLTAIPSRSSGPTPKPATP
ncbi:MAG: conjugal transfer protein TraG N-terminal domain-containing protein [Sphingomonadales bacterium]|nr:conjugal transfer protein TraG N-terminal domain-containing protein [Sphingomonadales bacterium]